MVSLLPSHHPRFGNTAYVIAFNAFYHWLYFNENNKKIVIFLIGNGAEIVPDTCCWYLVYQE